MTLGSVLRENSNAFACLLVFDIISNLGVFGHKVVFFTELQAVMMLCVKLSSIHKVFKFI